MPNSIVLDIDESLENWAKLSQTDTDVPSNLKENSQQLVFDHKNFTRKLCTHFFQNAYNI